jgi:hypothetical protein
VKPIIIKSNNTASIQTIQDISAPYETASISNEVIEPPINNSASTN